MDADLLLPSFRELYRRLLRIDLDGIAGEPMPAMERLPEALDAGALLLPLKYVEAYAQPLRNNLPRLLSLHSTGQLPDIALEGLTAAVYQHRADSPLRPALNRFLAVQSNVFRSFITQEKFAAVGLTLGEVLPPLALFQHVGNIGPVTATIEEVALWIGAPLGVVSLPATFASDPLIWAILAHETGGHVVAHAIRGVIVELAAGISMALSGIEMGEYRDQLSLLWQYWIEEAVADVCGVLNLGPAFAINMSAYFSAARARGVFVEPKLRMETKFSHSDSDQILDPHPTDILRVALTAGAVASLSGLADGTRTECARFLDRLSDFLSTGESIRIEGNIPVQRDHFERIDVTVPLKLMNKVARRVGGYLATAKLNALNGHALQALETWDDPDEERAQKVRAAILADQSARSLGDDAHLLAGATLAMLERPDLYDKATVRLNEALDQSFAEDPVWGTPRLHPVYISYEPPRVRPAIAPRLDLP